MSKDLMFPMPDQADDQSASSRQGPIQADVSRAVAKGAAPDSHPELAASHPDARSTRIADAEVNGEYAAFPDANNPDVLRARAPASSAPSSKLIPK